MSIVDKLNFLLTHFGLNGKQFALKCNMPYTTFRKIIEGRNEPSADNLRKIAIAFGINLNWLLNNEQPIFMPQITTLLSGKGRLFFVSAKDASGEEAEKLGVLEKICLMLDDMPKEQLYDLAKHIEDKKQALEDKKRLMELEQKLNEVLKKDCG